MTIPQIIHQIWGLFDEDAAMPEHFRMAQQSWREHHPQWAYMFWTRADVETLVVNDYPQFERQFWQYPEGIQRADVARYLILFKHGGIYADLDIVCRRSFEDLRGCAAFFPETKPLGLSNDLVGCAIESPIMAHLINRLEPAYISFQKKLLPRHLRVLLTTGSLFVTMALRNAPYKKTIHILPERLYGGGSDPDTYVTHVPGGTWHHWDSNLILLAYSYRGLISAVLAIFIAALVAAIWFH